MGREFLSIYHLFVNLKMEKHRLTSMLFSVNERLVVDIYTRIITISPSLS